MAKKKISVEVHVVDPSGSLKKVTVSGKKAKQVLDSLNATQAKGTTEGEKYRKQQGAINDSTRNSTKQFSKQAQGMGGLVSAYAATAANIWALTAAYAALKNAADKVIQLNSMAILDANSGTNLAGMAKALKEVSGGMISYQEAAQKATTISAAGFGKKEVLGLAKAAKAASQALGRDFGDSLDRMVRGVIKAEPELLDELGIILRLNTASEKYAETLGKSVSQLTTYEKQVAVMNEVLEQSSDKYGVLIENGEQVNQYQRLQASTVEALTSTMGVFSNALEPVVKFLSDSPKALYLALASLTAFIIKKAVPSLSHLSLQLTTFASSAAANAAASVANLATKQQHLVTVQKAASVSHKNSTAALKQLAQGMKDAGIAGKTLLSVMHDLDNPVNQKRALASIRATINSAKGKVGADGTVNVGTLIGKTTGPELDVMRGKIVDIVAGFKNVGTAATGVAGKIKVLGAATVAWATQVKTAFLTTTAAAVSASSQMSMVIAQGGLIAGLKNFGSIVTVASKGLGVLGGAAVVAGTSMGFLLSALGPIMWGLMGIQAALAVIEWFKSDETKAQEAALDKLKDGYGELAESIEKYGNHLTVLSSIETKTVSDSIKRFKFLANATKSFADAISASWENFSATIQVDYSIIPGDNPDVRINDKLRELQEDFLNDGGADKVKGSALKFYEDKLSGLTAGSIKTMDELAEKMKEFDGDVVINITKASKDNFIETFGKMSEGAKKAVTDAISTAGLTDTFTKVGTKGADVTTAEITALVEVIKNTYQEYADITKKYSDSTTAFSQLPGKDVTDFFKTIFPRALSTTEAAAFAMRDTVDDMSSSFKNMKSSDLDVKTLLQQSNQLAEVTRRLGLTPSANLLVQKDLDDYAKGLITLEELRAKHAKSLEDHSDTIEDYAKSLAPLVTKGLGNKLLVDTKAHTAALNAHNQVLIAFNNKAKPDAEDEALLAASKIGKAKAELQLLKEQMVERNAIAENELLVNGMGDKREEILHNQHKALVQNYKDVYEQTILAGKLEDYEKESLKLLRDHLIKAAELAEAERIRLKGITDYNDQLKITTAELSLQAAIIKATKLPDAISTNARKERIEAAIYRQGGKATVLQAKALAKINKEAALDVLAIQREGLILANKTATDNLGSANLAYNSLLDKNGDPKEGVTDQQMRDATLAQTNAQQAAVVSATNLVRHDNVTAPNAATDADLEEKKVASAAILELLAEQQAARDANTAKTLRDTELTSQAALAAVAKDRDAHDRYWATQGTNNSEQRILEEDRLRRREIAAAATAEENSLLVQQAAVRAQIAALETGITNKDLTPDGKAALEAALAKAQSELQVLKQERAAGVVAEYSKQEGVNADSRQAQIDHPASVSMAWKHASQEIGKNLKSIEETFADGLIAGSNKFADSFVDLIAAGDLTAESFGRMTASILADMAKMIAKMYIMKAIQIGMGSWGGPSGSVGSAASDMGAGGHGPGSGSMMGMARGGVVDRPTRVLFGEAGAEAFVPLPDGKNIPVVMSLPEGGGNGVTNNVNVSVSVESSGKTSTTSTSDNSGAASTGKLIASIVQQELMKQSRPGGLLNRG